jgi:DNA polymerase-3 subunit alpha
MTTEFASIHNHTSFSFQDGVATPEELVLAAKENGLRSLALTDHGHAHGHADFFAACKKHSYKGLYGVEAYTIHSLEEWRQLKERIAEEKRAKKAAKKAEDGEAPAAADEDIDLEEAEKDVRNRRALYRKGHLVLVAKNQRGLAGIYRATHAAFKTGFYQKPRMDKEMLRKFCGSGDVVASSACMGGVISNKLWQLQRDEAEWAEVVQEARELDEIFGRGNFYLEVQPNEHKSQAVINGFLAQLHRETGIPLVITQDAHYTKPDEWRAQQLLHLLLTHRGKRQLTYGSLPEDYDFGVKTLYVHSGEAMRESFLRHNPDFPLDLLEQAFENTLLIDSMVEPYAPDTTPRLPTLPYADPFLEMMERAVDGLAARSLQDDDRYRQRMIYELEVIREKGIATYFLVVKEIVEEARKKMLVGPGRGSAAGSLLCYLLGITNIDPIEHRLMFERFINLDRQELPDIDLDFEDVDEVKEALRVRFGEDNVACISAYGTNQIKGLLKDVCRIHDIDHGEVNKVNNQIEKELKALYQEGETRSTVTVKLDDVYRLSPTFNSFLLKYPQIEQQVRQLYGRPHHVSRHASGVVIGDDLPGETAVFYAGGGDKRVLQTSFTDGIVNKNLSNMGLVKFDILSLATLSVIKKTCELVARDSGRPIEEVFDEIDPKKMNFNDMNVMKTVFWEGNLTGIFQVTSKGMAKLLQQVKPTTFDDVAAVCALYRPGPLGSGMDQMFARRKNGLEKVTYDHPLLEQIMGDTYGCLVYQEQMLEIGRRLGNMSWKDTNRLRKLFLKKDKSKADEFVKKEETELKTTFSAGCVANGLSEAKADELWEMLGYFGGYGFNASHAKAYGMVTMQTAYLRTYHPLRFFAAVLTMGQAGDLQEHVENIRRQGFKVLPVDVNASKDEHTIEGDAIRLALSSVKGVGKAVVPKIIAGQPYSGFVDFLYRSKANKTHVTNLASVGALSGFGDHEALTLKKFELYTSLKGATKKGREKFEAQVGSLTAEQFDPMTLMQMERDLLQFNLRHSPFSMNGRAEKIARFIEAGAAVDYDEFVDSEEEWAYVPAFLKDWRERPQRNKQMFAFMKFGTRDGREFEAPAFSGVWNHVKSVVRKNEIYLVALNHKADEPANVVVGQPGWAHSRMDALGFFVRIDDLE